ncbi:GNAT family N-acetyltransferase [Sphingomonas panacisoli]|uniref:GNAT family N-acetyltransferase n=1 Tax=Sphingomonas panacisoli TaxID=1813879 RepID=A0A5B8LEQ5_9SPHN|nr:GNAT family N-acetyltransferase [Sphingomonas panacisoli]QDZ06668.1 GNAT family N-acetyltransferase [Sphingomonas panacisoli]
MSFATRIATAEDIPAIAALMDRAIAELQRAYLSDTEIAASRNSMGLDTQLIADGTYVVVEEAGRIVGCGGWSWRATLYGGDHNPALRNAAPLDPAKDAARIRAMYTDPDYVRRGIGRMVLAANEASATAAGFCRAELMATLAGEPLYLACGYEPIERVEKMSDGGVPVPGVKMGKTLTG